MSKDDNQLREENKRLKEELAELKRKLSEQNSSTQELEESKQYFRNLFERVPMGYQSLDEEGRFLDVNFAWLEMTGYPKDEVVGKWFGDFLADEYVPHFRKNFPKFKAAGEISGVEFKVRTKSGEYIFVSFQGKIGKNSDGKFMQTHCLMENITAKKLLLDEVEKNKKLLIKNEKLFRFLYNSLSHPVVIYDKDARIVMINDMAVHELQVSKEDLIGSKMEDYLHELKGVLKERLHTVLNSNEVTVFVDHFSYLGKEYFFNSIYQPIHENEDLQDCVMVSSYDFTERKKANDKLKEHQLLLESIFNALQDGIIVINRDFTSERFNNTISEWFQPELGAEHKCYGLLYNRPVPCDTCPAKKTFTDGKLHTEIFETIDKTGKKKWLEVFTYPLFDDEGKVVKVIDHIRDITENKQYQSKLQQNEKMLSLILETVPVAILMVRNQRIMWANNHFVQMTGYSKAELENSDFSFLFDSTEEFKRTRELISDGFRDKNQLSLETQWSTKSGRIIDLQYFLSLIEDNNPQAGYLAAVMNITDRKKYERDILKERDKAENANSFKTNLLANVNHEFRTPINGILGLTSILEEIIEDDEQRRMASMIKDSTNRLMNTLNSIVVYADLSAKKSHPDLSVIRLSEPITDVCTKYRNQILKKKLSFNIKGTEKDIFVRANSDAIQQILSNIIDNAIKFTDEGEITLTVEQITYNEDTYAQLSVQDTGIGIAEKDLHLIFQEFRQASEGMSRAYEGTGLGLSISKKLVEAIGGEIDIESEPDKGTTATITLKTITNEREKIAGAPQSDQFTPSQDEIHASFSILVVEDNDVNVEVITMYLKDVYQIDCATDADSAIEMAKRKAYDLILMDINLGMGMNGIVAAKKIRELLHHQYTPFIAVTGYALEEDKRNLLEEGFTDHLPKPFTESQLLAKIEDILKINQE